MVCRSTARHYPNNIPAGHIHSPQSPPHARESPESPHPQLRASRRDAAVPRPDPPRHVAAHPGFTAAGCDIGQRSRSSSEPE